MSNTIPADRKVNETEAQSVADEVFSAVNRLRSDRIHGKSPPGVECEVHSNASRSVKLTPIDDAIWR
eukprot:COSAG05_NODE_169_length_15161_cov_279.150644_2_plen_67_part_00